MMCKGSLNIGMRIPFLACGCFASAWRIDVMCRRCLVAAIVLISMFMERRSLRDAMPAAKARVKITSVDGQPIPADSKFRILLNSNGAKPIDFTGDAWSEWVTLPLAEKPNATQHFTCNVTQLAPKPIKAPRIQLTAES